MDSQTRNYEISYLINPEIPEDQVVGEAGKITGFIQDARGLVGRIEEPKKRRLAYPMNHVTHAYIGLTTFTIAPEFLPELEKKLRLEKNIVRYTITLEIRRPIFEFRARPRREVPAPSAESPSGAEAAAKEEDKINIEELDKKLEEILGK